MREQTWAPGSAAVLDALARPGGPRISPEAKLVYLALFAYMGPEDTCYPSQGTLVTGLGMPRRTLQRRLEELEGAQLITRTGRVGQVTVYRLYPPWRPRLPANPSDTMARPTAVDLRRTDANPRQPDATSRPTDAPPCATLTPKVTHASNPVNSSSTLPTAAGLPSSPPADEPWPKPIPQVLEPFALYLLRRTGQRKLGADDVDALWLLEAQHTPEAIRSKTAEILQRWERTGRPATGLTVGYLWNSMRHYSTRKGGKTAHVNAGAKYDGFG